MKRLSIRFICCLSLLFLYGCEPPILYKVITVRNASSYDLRVNFGTDSQFLTSYKEIDLKKNEKSSFLLKGSGLSDPNYTIEKIVISILATNETIEVYNTNKNLLKETSSSKNKTDYLLEITDDLLK